MNVMQDLWRPLLISCFDIHSHESMGATILSIESQADSLATMIIFALLLGLAIDYVRSNQIGSAGFWLLGAVSVFISLVFFYLQKMLQGEINKDKTSVKAEILALASPRCYKFAMESIRECMKDFLCGFMIFFLKKFDISFVY